MKRPRRSQLVLAGCIAALAFLTAAFDMLPQSRGVRGQVWGLSQANYHEFRDMLGSRKLPALDQRFAFSRSPSEAAAVRADPPGGVVTPGMAVHLMGNGRIYYTLDGSIPTRRSDVYREPILLDSGAVLRARHLPRNSLPGPISTWHYIDLPESRVPVVSLAMDPVDLWNKYVGIYEKPLGRGRAWERAAHVGVRRHAGPPFGFAAEARIHGGYSRHSPKKSFRLTFRTDSITLPADDILVATALNGSNAVILRTAVNPATSVRDALASALYEDLGGIVSRGEPVELMLNGAYWGLYQMRERIADGFLQRRFGRGSYETLKHDSENARDWLTPDSGSGSSWDSTIAKLERLDARTDSGRDSLEAMFDVDQMIDYWIHNIFTANIDWPYNNTQVFRRVDGPDHRWRWLAWDLDPTFIHLEHNTLAWALRDRIRNDLKWNYRRGVMEDQPHQVISTLPARRLVESPALRERFAARAQVLLALHYTEERIRTRTEEIIAAQRPVLARDAERWGWAPAQLDDALALIDRFSVERAAHMRQHIAAYFGLGEPVTVRIHSDSGTRVLAERYPLPLGGAELVLLRGTTLDLIVERDGERIVRTVQVAADTALTFD